MITLALSPYTSTFILRPLKHLSKHHHHHPQGQMDENLKKIGRAFSQKAQSFCDNMEGKKAAEINAVKISLSNAHTVELRLLENMYNGKLAAQTSEYQVL
jgi:hypothetical protein